MIWNKHYNMNNKHAFLSGSKYSWLNYDDKKLVDTYNNYLSVQKGTELHELAADLIKHQIKLPRTKDTLNQYVNDAIGFKLTPEQLLYYSDNCFGTADAISFRKNFLRIHDLKTGVTPAHMEQLEIYAALFCLEYNVDPRKIDVELRLYQNNDKFILNPEPDDILDIMSKINRFSSIIDDINNEFIE